MRPSDVLEFWFGQAAQSPQALSVQTALWFGKSDDTPADRDRRDQEIRSRFGQAFEEAAAGRLDDWADTPPGRLALILLLDQMPRNLFRGSARAFATDGKARALTVAGLDAGVDRELSPLERVFFYLPLEHAESLADQERCVALFDDLAREAPAEFHDDFQGFARFARWHRDIVARFGRFPHRNAVLGRSNTPEEAAYLAGDAPSFGQG